MCGFLILFCFVWACFVLLGFCLFVLIFVFVGFLFGFLGLVFFFFEKEKAKLGGWKGRRIWGREKHGNILCEKSLIESEKKSSQLRAVSPLTRQASVMAFQNPAMMKVK